MKIYFITVLISFATLLVSFNTNADGTIKEEVPQQQTEQDNSKATYKDIEKTFGFVPAFLEQYPSASVDGAWAQMKSFQLNNKTATSQKHKELMGLAVAAQIPCDYCVEMHTKMAKAYGATDQEVKESIAMSAATRHWSTVLNGLEIDRTQFTKDVDKLIQNVEKSKKLAE